MCKTQEGLSSTLLPAAFIAGLTSLTGIPAVHHNPRLLGSFVGAAALLALWNAVLALRARSRTLRLEVSLRKQHYLQACAHLSIFIYWGWYWRPVYESAYLIAAQLLFAYGLDMLIAWSRRDTYTLGFGPFPIILSTNLFLWFRPDWFFFQFAMVALGFAAKELIRWEKDGRPAHIFNPSSFTLAVFSLGLLATHSSGITFGQDIAATQFYPPQMYLFLFLIGLPGQFFFGVTTMTMSAVLTAFAFGRIYFGMTGIYFFYDSYIPIAVFLGMHLLFTDPSTSPRTELGRLIFGALYGLSVVGLYEILGRFGMPTFYDKLLQVPLLNLTIQGIDAAVRSRWLRWLDPSKLVPALAPRARNLAYMSVWASAFVVLSAVGGVGDHHPGQYLPFWHQACADGRAFACPYLADMELRFCDNGSGWACNEAGLMHIALARSGEDLRRVDPAGAAVPLKRGCTLGFGVACANLETLTTGSGRLASAAPALEDYPIILRGSKGEVREREPQALYALACSEGWPGTCDAALVSASQ